MYIAGLTSVKRFNLLKRLASTDWETNKTTLCQLYTGYVCAVFDYSAPLQPTTINTNHKKLDSLQLKHILSCYMELTKQHYHLF